MNELSQTLAGINLLLNKSSRVKRKISQPNSYEALDCVPYVSYLKSGVFY